MGLALAWAFGDVRGPMAHLIGTSFLFFLDRRIVRLMKAVAMERDI